MSAEQTFPKRHRKVKSEKTFFCPMAPVVWSVESTFGSEILGSDTNLTFCVQVIFLTKFHVCALKWSEKTHTDLTMKLYNSGKNKGKFKSFVNFTKKINDNNFSYNIFLVTFIIFVLSQFVINIAFCNNCRIL